MLKFFKHEYRRIISNIIWMLFDKVFLLFLNLVVTVRIANYYGTSKYGLFEYAVSVIAIFEIIVNFVDSRIVKKKYLSENPSELVWNATLTRLFFSTVALLVGVVYLFFCNESEEYCIVFLILLSNAIVLSLRFGMQNRYEYLLKSKKVIIASNIALTFGGILQLLAVSAGLRLFVIATITLLSSMVSFIIVYIQYRIEFGYLKAGKLKRSLICELIIESFPLAIASSCAIIYSRCDSIMIGNMLSKAEVGIYAIAVKLISVVHIGIIPIRESIYPDMIKLYDRNREIYAKKYVQITAILTWIYILGVLFSFVVLPYVFQFLNQEYADAFPIYKVYVISAFFMYNAGLRAGHYTLIDRGNVLMYSQIISVIVNIVLNYVLIKSIGVYGAALATSITQGISLLISNLFFGKVGKDVFVWQLKGMNPKYIFNCYSDNQ